MAQYKNSGIRLDGEAADRSLTGIAAAWVNMDGTGTIAVQDSHNVSSITDNGTGSYDSVFTSAMSNASYSVAGSADDDIAQCILATSTIATGSVDYRTTNTATSADNSRVCVQVMGDLA